MITTEVSHGFPNWLWHLNLVPCHTRKPLVTLKETSHLPISLIMTLFRPHMPMYISDLNVPISSISAMLSVRRRSILNAIYPHRKPSQNKVSFRLLHSLPLKSPFIHRTAWTIAKSVACELRSIISNSYCPCSHARRALCGSWPPAMRKQQRMWTTFRERHTIQKRVVAWM